MIEQANRLGIRTLKRGLLKLVALCWRAVHLNTQFCISVWIYLNEFIWMYLKLKCNIRPLSIAVCHRSDAGVCCCQIRPLSMSRFTFCWLILKLEEGALLGCSCSRFCAILNFPFEAQFQQIQFISILDRFNL